MIILSEIALSGESVDVCMFASSAKNFFNSSEKRDERHFSDQKSQTSRRRSIKRAQSVNIRENLNLKFIRESNTIVRIAKRINCINDEKLSTI